VHGTLHNFQIRCQNSFVRGFSKNAVVYLHPSVDLGVPVFCLCKEMHTPFLPFVRRFSKNAVVYLHPSVAFGVGICFCLCNELHAPFLFFVRRFSKKAVVNRHPSVDLGVPDFCVQKNARPLPPFRSQVQQERCRVFTPQRGF
jgi:hypothetical protein